MPPSRGRPDPGPISARGFGGPALIARRRRQPDLHRRPPVLVGCAHRTAHLDDRAEDDRHPQSRPFSGRFGGDERLEHPRQHMRRESSGLVGDPQHDHAVPQEPLHPHDDRRFPRAVEMGCDFVHLGQEDLAGADLAAIRRSGLRLGISSHDEVELAKALAAKPDYVALGPVFPTLLKKMPWAPQGLEKLDLWRGKIGDLPLVAIGGLTPERAAECLRAGADSAAVVTDITLNPDPEARARQWIAATRAFSADGYFPS